MSTQSKRTASNVGGGTSHKTRVIENNIFGKPVDRLTAEQMQTKNDPHLTIYNQDYAKKQSIEKSKPQHALEQNKPNAPVIKQTSANVGFVSPQAQNVGLVGQGHNNQQRPYTEAKKSQPKSHQASTHELSNRNQVEDKKTESQNNLDSQSVQDEMKKSYLLNPNIQIDSEAEYYETVRRLDVCGTCWAGQQKYHTAPFKLKQKGPGQTLYQKDYVAHPLENKGNVIKNDFYGTFNIEEPIDFGTTMANAYKPWKPEPAMRAGPTDGKQGSSGIPFAGRSGYKAEYIDWGNMPIDYEKAPNTKTVISELPFVGRSAYTENYKHQPVDPARPIDKSKNKSPLSPGIPFLGQTTHNLTYKPYKVGGAPMFSIQNDYEPTEAYPGQYDTLYKQDYTQPHKWKCPAKIFMETHPHPRQQYLKS